MAPLNQLLIEVGALMLGLGLLGRLAGRIGLSPIPLYLLAGLAFGQGGLWPMSASEEFVQAGAQIGVILLLLMLGLAYSAGELVSNMRRAAPAGVVDAVLNTLPGVALALLLGWGPVAAVALAGICWNTSSGVVAKLLHDLGRMGNRETPVVLSLLVIEDLAMALYLPLLTALLLAVGVVSGAVSLTAAIVTVLAVIVAAIRYGPVISKVVSVRDSEVLLLTVFGLTLLVAGVAAQLQISAAVGAFLVGIALSGSVARHASRVVSPLRALFAAVFFVFFGLATDPTDIPDVLLPAALLAFVTVVTKVVAGQVAAKRAGIHPPGRWRAGFLLTPRGEFSVVIAGLAVGAGIEPRLAPLATVYVLLTVLAASVLARSPGRPRLRRRRRPPRPEPAG